MDTGVKSSLEREHIHRYVAEKTYDFQGNAIITDCRIPLSKQRLRTVSKLEGKGKRW